MSSRNSHYPAMLICMLFFWQAGSVWAQDSKRKAVAQKGDGIHLLLQKNGLDPAIYTSRFIELNSTILGRNNFLIEGVLYVLPLRDASKTVSVNGMEVIEFPLFGPEYSTVHVKDHKLKGAVYYLISGHGGPDPGAITRYGSHTISEDEYAYDVTLRLARRLMEHGAQVYMIVQDPKNGIRNQQILKMDQNEVVYPNQTIPINQRARLKQRTDAVNKLYTEYAEAYQRLIEIHLDSRSEGTNIDVFFYHHHNSEAGKRLANQIHQTFFSKYAAHQPGRNYDGTVTARSGLYVIRYASPPTVFIELGNIRNRRDQPRFIIPNNRQALANWIAEGIITDYTAGRDQASAMN